jgi:hypothetical protein
MNNYIVTLTGDHNVWVDEQSMNHDISNIALELGATIEISSYEKGGLKKASDNIFTPFSSQAVISSSYGIVVLSFKSEISFEEAELKVWTCEVIKNNPKSFDIDIETL